MPWKERGFGIDKQAVQPDAESPSELVALGSCSSRSPPVRVEVHQADGVLGNDHGDHEPSEREHEANAKPPARQGPPQHSQADMGRNKQTWVSPGKMSHDAVAQGPQWIDLQPVQYAGSVWQSQYASNGAEPNLRTVRLAGKPLMCCTMPCAEGLRPFWLAVPQCCRNGMFMPASMPSACLTAAYEGRLGDGPHSTSEGPPLEVVQSNTSSTHLTVTLHRNCQTGKLLFHQSPYLLRSRY